MSAANNTASGGAGSAATTEGSADTTTTATTTSTRTSTSTPAWQMRPDNATLFVFVAEESPTRFVLEVLQVALADHGLKLEQLTDNSGTAVRADGKKGCSLSFTTGRHAVQGNMLAIEFDRESTGGGGKMILGQIGQVAGGMAAGGLLIGLGLVSFGIGVGVTLASGELVPLVLGAAGALESGKAAHKAFGKAADVFKGNTAKQSPIASMYTESSGPTARGYGMSTGTGTSAEAGDGELPVIMPVGAFVSEHAFADYFFKNVSHLFGNAGLVRVPDEGAIVGFNKSAAPLQLLEVLEDKCPVLGCKLFVVHVTLKMVEDAVAAGTSTTGAAPPPCWLQLDVVADGKAQAFFKVRMRKGRAPSRFGGRRAGVLQAKAVSKNAFAVSSPPSTPDAANLVGVWYVSVSAVQAITFKISGFLARSNLAINPALFGAFNSRTVAGVCDAGAGSDDEWELVEGTSSLPAQAAARPQRSSTAPTTSSLPPLTHAPPPNLCMPNAEDQDGLTKGSDLRLLTTQQLTEEIHARGMLSSLSPPFSSSLSPGQGTTNAANAAPPSNTNTKPPKTKTDADHHALLSAILFPLLPPAPVPSIPAAAAGDSSQAPSLKSLPKYSKLQNRSSPSLFKMAPNIAI